MVLYLFCSTAGYRDIVVTDLTYYFPVYYNLLWKFERLRKNSLGVSMSHIMCHMSHAQMFGPFLDPNPHFFGKISLSWFVMQDFRKWIGSIVLWPNHPGKLLWGRIWIFVEVIFFNPSEIGVLGLTWRVLLLSRCNLNTLRHLFSRHNLSYHDLLLIACNIFWFQVMPQRQHSCTDETSANCTDCTFSWGKNTILYCTYSMARQQHDTNFINCTLSLQ